MRDITVVNDDEVSAKNNRVSSAYYFIFPCGSTKSNKLV